MLERQALADGLGHTERSACQLAEVDRAAFVVEGRSNFFHEFQNQAIIDCKTLYNHLHAYVAVLATSKWQMTSLLRKSH